jgi:hypothetical protein
MNLTLAGRFTLAVLTLLMAPGLAEAYVGPGSGLTVIGAALAFLGSIVLVVIGFVWYPMKRLWRWWTHDRRNSGAPVKSASR